MISRYHLGLRDHFFSLFNLVRLWLPRHNQTESEAEEDAGPGDDCKEPKPEEDIDLLIDDIDREDAETIMLHDCSGWSVLVKSTLCHFWENFCHRIYPLLHGCSEERDCLRTIGGELTAKELVHKAHLTNDIDQIQELTKNEFVDIGIVFFQIPKEIVDNECPFFFGFIWFMIQGSFIQVL